MFLYSLKVQCGAGAATATGRRRLDSLDGEHVPQKSAAFASVGARYLRLVAVRGVNGFAAAAELSPVFA
jgi:hypothetical protein